MNANFMLRDRWRIQWFLTPKSKSPSWEKSDVVKPTAGAIDDCKVIREKRFEDQTPDDDAESTFLTPSSKQTLAEHSFKQEILRAITKLFVDPLLALIRSSSKEDIAKGAQFAKRSTMSSEKKEKPGVAPAQLSSLQRPSEIGCPHCLEQLSSCRRSQGINSSLSQPQS